MTESGWSRRATRGTNLLKRWEALWFTEVPPHSYALLRILFGLLGLVSLLGLTPVSMFWALDGFTPVPGGGLGVKAELLRLGLGTAAGWIYFSGLLLSFVSTTVGYRTGLAIVAGLVGSLLQTRWNGLPLSSAHQVVIAVLFCLLWADCGAVWSIDARLNASRNPLSPSREAAQPIWPLRLIRIQVALIYLNSGLWKLFSPIWRDGSAVHYVMQMNVFHRFPLVMPPELDWVLTLASYGTLFWEIGFVFLLMHRRTRLLALVAGVAIHLSMWVALELGPFGWVMLASYVAFLDPKAVKRWFDTRRFVGGIVRSPGTV